MPFNPLQGLFGGVGAGFLNLGGGGAGADVPTGPRADIPQNLLPFFQGIQQQGIFGQGGAGQIANQALGAAARSGVSRGLRRSVGRRLGPRSGAAETVVANRVVAPQFRQLSQLLASLEAQNRQSRLGGAAGQFDVLRFLEDRFNIDRDFRLREEEGELGFLDFVGPGLDIAGAFGFGVPGQGTAARNLFGGGGSMGNNTVIDPHAGHNMGG